MAGIPLATGLLSRPDLVCLCSFPGSSLCLEYFSLDQQYPYLWSFRSFDFLKKVTLNILSLIDSWPLGPVTTCSCLLPQRRVSEPQGEAVTAWSPLHHQGSEQHLHLAFVKERILREVLMW